MAAETKSMTDYAPGKLIALIYPHEEEECQAITGKSYAVVLSEMLCNIDPDFEKAIEKIKEKWETEDTPTAISKEMDNYIHEVY